MVTIEIHTSEGGILTIPDRMLKVAVSKAEQSCALLGEDVVNISIESATIIDFKIGCWIDVYGKTYTLNQLPSVKKTASNRFSYTLQFESEQYELMDCAWLLPENTYGDSFTGNLTDFCKILINENISRSRNDWALGSVPNTDFKTLTYSSQNCLQVLQNLCKEFDCEFEIVRNAKTRVLNFRKKVGTDFPHAFSYGRTGGAYTIERKTNTNQNVVTKLFAFGSSNNLGSQYRYSRLCLPDKSKNQSYITDENVVAIFGKRENVRMWDDIKPERTGEITAEPADYRTFTDSTMDFDLNETAEAGSTKWLINGTSAKVTFQTGNLAGYTFDLNAYNHATKTFVINTFTDENGLVFPSKTSKAFQFSKGDKYILTDILVPQQYIEDAENRLQTEAQKYFDEYCKPHVDYTIQINPLYLEGVSGEVDNVFAVGDTIHIIDADLGIDDKIRVARFQRNLFDKYAYTLTLSNNIAISVLERVVAGINDNNERIVNITTITNQNTQRAWRVSQDILNSVFDTEGHYFSEKIKPLSIETSMLAVGARSQQFLLKDVVVESNFEGDVNKVNVLSKSGTLEHYTIAEPETRVWNIAEGSVVGLDPNKIYYIYARCEKTGDNGILEFSEVQRKPDEPGEYYYFLCGNLSSPINGARATAMTYGTSTINGRFIRTGRIESEDGSVYIDLDTNEIAGRMNFTGGLISGRIWVGEDEESAVAGMGGDNLLYAGKNGDQYLFNITKDGCLYYYNTEGRRIFWLDKDGSIGFDDMMWGKEMLLTTGLSVGFRSGHYTYIDDDGISYGGVSLTKTDKWGNSYSKDGQKHYITAWKIGKVVSVVLRAKPSVFNNLFPLPEKYRPIDFAIMPTIHNQATDDNRALGISYDGGVFINNIGSNDYFYGQCTYIVN